MEPNESGLSPYYHPHHHSSQPQHASPATATNNGILPNSPRMVYPHSVPPPPVSSALETVRRKRGRPRKYGTPEQAAAAKRMSSAASTAVKKDAAVMGGAGSSSGKKAQLGSLGGAGQGFIPHIITVAAGEDVGQKIMFFMQQSKRDLCILSASGSISNASLRQAATFGGSITYEGRFDIISLSGSYIRNELGGRSGGLSVCLSSTDGQIIGGGVAGPLTAAGPIQVIVGAFLMDTKKDIVGDVKTDSSGNKSPSPIGGISVSNAGFPATVDSSVNQYMIQPRSMQMTPPHTNEWTGTDTRNSASYDFSEWDL
ncbi:AT-hook motif nuclear-localized protein 14 isoform X2 [Daucus carota subsp. sativus]|uniref:AT-hook motif nuclear-localized protein 14 isoform X2 n=1 Tax=Daucus carota subsp. sativus TaxID=79200 RepID=UPI0007EF1AB3|nr:PREDICTED: AT-hook motif nuclear-localized protein 14-like isoform X2 [Daucus carota subsp. sativus]